MPDTERNAPAEAASGSLFRQTGLLVGLLLDGLIAAAAYDLAYRLRFPGERLAAFLTGAWTTLPLVVTCQLAALLLTGTYRVRSGRLSRIVLGAFGGSAGAALLVGLLWGFEGISRVAFVADAMLVSVGAVAWRGVWTLASVTNWRANRSVEELVDRAAERTTIPGVVAALFTYRELIKNLVLKDLKLKYRGSFFGFLWSMANPLMMILVYSFAFTYIMGNRTEGFVFQVMLGVLSWNFFAGSAGMSAGAIVDNAGLLKSVSFPRVILPLSTVLFSLAQYLLTLAVFLPVMLLWYQVPLSTTMLLFPVFLVLHVTFTIGVAFVLATATAFFRDVRHLLEVALAVMFWTTPILYELRTVPESFRLLVLLSPMSPFIVAYKQLLYFREWPDPTLWVVATVYAAGMLMLGATLMLAYEDRFTEQL